MSHRRFGYLVTFILFTFVLAGCDLGSAAPTTTPAASSMPGTATAPASGATAPATTAAGGVSVITPAPTRPLPTVDPSKRPKVTIALGYTPDVQFAPFYVALHKGYYADEGVDVSFKSGIVPDLIKLLGTGDQNINFAVASGDEIIPARLQGIPVIYVMTWYRQYPVAAASVVGKGPTLKTPADLKGHTVGVPGPYGSSYTGLLALLKTGKLTLNDINMKSIGYTQVENLAQGQVDTAMVYTANEPVQLRAQGFDVSTLSVADFENLASNGLVTNVQTFRNDPLLIARIVRATVRGIQDTIKDPQAAFQYVLQEVPQAGGANKDTQLKVLEETVKLMQAKPGDPAAGQPTGWTDAQLWSDTQDFLYDAKLISQKGKVQEMFSNRFIPTTSP